MIQYLFPPGKQPDTEEDSIAIGFITMKTDAVLLRIESATSQDYMELEIVMKARHDVHNDFHKWPFLVSLRLRVTYSWCTTLDRMICRSAKLAPKSTTIHIMWFGSNDSAATPHFS